MVSAPAPAFAPVRCPFAVPAGARFTDDFRWLVTPAAGVFAVRCDWGSAAAAASSSPSSSTCAFDPVVATKSLRLGDAVAAAVPHSVPATNTTLLYVASDVGLTLVDVGGGGAASSRRLLPDTPPAAAAAAAAAGPAPSSPGQVVALALSSAVPGRAWGMPAVVLAAGGRDKLWFLDPDTGRVLRWEWCTDTATEQGGVVDDRVTALRFAPWADDPGALVVGNPTALNVVFSNGTLVRLDGDDGVPYGNVTSIWSDAAAPSSAAAAAASASAASASAASASRLWLGTTRGVVLFDPSPAAVARWRYLHGPRWLAGDSAVVAVVGVVAAAAAPAAGHGDGDYRGGVLVSTGGGLTALLLLPGRPSAAAPSPPASGGGPLARRAAAYSRMALDRHLRHGMVGGCNLAAFGDVATCTLGDDDNNGLWTSLMVVAEYVRHRVTGDPAALAAGSRWFAGMALLNNVTATRGLMARSCCSPDEYNKTCGGHTHDDEQWHPSADPRYAGWWWKGDTSSDETAGHAMALTVVARLSPLAWERALARDLLTAFVGGVVRHGYQLIDVTGNATTWGKWDPAHVNGWRGFSDERGLQSLQILAYLAAAMNVTSAAGGAEGGAGAGAGADTALYAGAYRELTNTSTHQYGRNVLNTKILSPCDDNYSDDELAWLPLFTFFFACGGGGGGGGGGGDTMCPFAGGNVVSAAPIKAALERSWTLIAAERSALWAAIYGYAVMGVAGATTTTTVAEHADAQALRSTLLWNLRSWPLELVDWPVDNSAREDVLYEATKTRFNMAHIESLKSRSPLPADERRQYRWNANPYLVAPPGGAGLQEGDPGAWLLPYWLGRWTGLLGEDD